jgi:predicted cytidylate kinase
MIISINGTPGSGKSTIAKKIATALNYKHYYMGAIRREKAREMGMTLTQYNTYGETHPETDLEVEEYLKKLGTTTDNFVIESRTSWYLLPQSIKIFITVDPKIGADRVYKELQSNNQRNEDRELKNVTELLNSHRNRMTSDKLRYKKYYNIDYTDPKNFDFIIDTSHLTPDEVFQQILNYIKKNKQNA